MAGVGFMKNPYESFIRSHHNQTMNMKQYNRAYKAHEGLIKTVYKMNGTVQLTLNNGKSLTIYIREN